MSTLASNLVQEVEKQIVAVDVRVSISELSVAHGLDSSLSPALNVLTMSIVQISFKGPTTGLDPYISISA